MAGASRCSPGRALLRLIVAWCGLWAQASPSLADTVPLYAESAVKAAFVLRFAGYVQWPPEAIQDNEFVIAVLGDAALAGHLENLSAGRSIAGRPVRVRRIGSMEQAQSVQVLVVGAARRAELRTLLRPLTGRSVLVVSAEERGLADGSVINFVMDQDRVRFEVSLPSARRMGLRVSSELLSVAARVVQ